MTGGSVDGPSPSGATSRIRSVSPSDSLPAGFDAERLREHLERAVRQVCPRWLVSEADDFVQTAMIKVMDIARRREGTVELSAFYLRKTAYSAVVDEIRRRRRRREVPLEDDREELDRPGLDQPVDVPGPERRTAGRELGSAIHECLAELIRPRRLAVTLHLQGHRIKEVGELMGWNRKKAENLIYRGLADLRTCLAERGVAP